MLTVHTIREKSVAGRRWQDEGAPIKSALFYCKAGLITAIVVLVVIPLIWTLWGGDPKGAAALWVRSIMFAGSLFSLGSMLMAVGVGVTGQRMGVLWAARNAYSLSRLQIVLWTLLVLGALAALVACRSFGLFVASGSGGVSGALTIDIPPELLTVLGISLFSGVAAPAILSLKTQSETPQPREIGAASLRTGSSVSAIGSVAARPGDCPPLVKDLFQGDEVSKAGTVDMGKVQQAVVTAILWCSYLAMLAQMFVLGESPHPPKVPGGTALPLMPETFVYLLGISHAGYLAYKAAPSPGGATAGAQAQPVLPSATMPRPAPPTL